MATSLPRRARRSLRLPSSWATEINLQSRYPGGILIPKMGAASSSVFRDARAEAPTTPATVATATSKKAAHFIRCPPCQYAYLTYALLDRATRFLGRLSVTVQVDYLSGYLVCHRGLSQPGAPGTLNVKNRQSLEPTRRSHRQPCPRRNDRRRERELERSVHRGGSARARRDQTKRHTFPRSPKARLRVAHPSLPFRVVVHIRSIVVEQVSLNLGLAGLAEKGEFIGPQIRVVAFHARIISNMAGTRCSQR